MDIERRLRGNKLSLHQQQVRRKRQVIDCVVNVVKVIGKRDLSYRGSEFEAAYTLEEV